jgi:hypothetical protein
MPPSGLEVWKLQKVHVRGCHTRQPRARNRMVHTQILELRDSREPNN